MNIALHIDGTISERPEFFALLAAAFRRTGHRVFVLTFRDPARANATKAQLAAWGVEFDHLLIAPSLAAKGGLSAAHAVVCSSTTRTSASRTCPSRCWCSKPATAATSTSPPAAG